MLATKFGMPMDDAGIEEGRLAPLHHVGGRGEPDAAAHRLDRPLPAAPARPAARRSRRRCARSTISCGRARCATSAARTSRAGRSPTRRGRRAITASRRSSARRTSTACSSAGTSATWCPRSRRSAWACCPYFPLAGGLLTGKYRREAPLPEGARLTYTKALRRQVPRPSATGRARKRWPRSPRRAATRCSSSRSRGSRARKPVSSIIAGATKPEQIDANVAAVGVAAHAGRVGRDRSHHRIVE